MAKPSAPTVADEPGVVVEPGSVASRYAIGDELARGGVGVVRLAVDDRLGRTVAIKQLLAPLPANRARFEREARITARLEHPGVVPIYDRGVGEDGEPYYVMRRVAGRTLADEIVRTDDRLRLIPIVQTVADTLAYAHDQRVIHRDLKPTNVLVGDHGETLVIDWGLAKQLDDDDDFEPVAGDVAPGLTSVGAVIGTPRYMSPEQAAGEPCDRRSDVYALGAILDHALAGAVTDGTPLADRAPGCPTELLAIANRAMARAPADRYADAGAFAADLRAFQTGQLVSAHRYTAWRRLARWVRRHRAAVAVGAPLGLALAVTAVIAVQRVRVARDQAEAALVEVGARDRELALRQAEAMLDRDPTATLAWLKSAQPSTDWRVRSLGQTAVARGVAREVYATETISVVADGERAVFADADGHVWEWSRGVRRLLADGVPHPRTLAIAGTRVVVGSQDGTITELGAGQHVLGRARAAIRSCAFAGDGSVWCGDAGGTLHHLGGGELALDGSITVVAARGTRWCAGLDNGTLVLGGVGEPRRLRAHTRDIGAIRFVDDDTFVTAAEDGLVLRWSAVTGEHTELAHHADWVSALALSDDGTRVATASGDRTIRITPLAGGEPIILEGHRAAILGLAWHGDTLASASVDGTLRLWHPGRGSAVIAGASARKVAWVGDTLISAGGTLRVWGALPVIPDRLAGALGEVHELATSADGAWLAAVDRERRVSAWSTATLAEDVHGELPSAGAALRFTPAELVAAADLGAVRWDLATKKPLAATTVTGTTGPIVLADGRVAWIDSARAGITVDGRVLGPARELATLAADATSIISGDIEGHVVRWPLTGAAPVPLGTIAHVERVAVSPDGMWTIALDRSGDVWGWPRGGSGRRVATDASDALALTADGRLVVGIDDSLAIVDLATAATTRLHGHRARITTVELAGDFALTADTAGEVRIWRLRDGASAVVAGFAARTPLSAAPDHRVAGQTADGGIARIAWPTELLATDAAMADWLAHQTTAVLDVRFEPRSP